MPYKLTLDLERFVLGTGYCLHAAVNTDPLKTDPVELIPSLLVRLATLTQPDVIARVCTRTDLEEYPELVLPYDYVVVKLSSTDIGMHLMSLSVGDIVTIDPIPDLWEYILGSPAPVVATVAVVSSPPTGDYVLVSVPFPAYAAGLTYKIEHLGAPVVSGTDAVASRFNAQAEMYCRVPEDYSMFADLSEAINKLISIRAEAQGLVDDYEESGTEFEGISEEVFT